MDLLLVLRWKQGSTQAIYEVPIKHTVAMTGEIGLHGNVKPIGGVIPKSRQQNKRAFRW